MNNIFYYCESLTSLPDISDWNIKNVTNMKDMFYLCSSLTFKNQELKEKLEKKFNHNFNF